MTNISTLSIRTIVLFILIAFFVKNIEAQKILLEEDVRSNYQQLLKGQNRLHYHHIFLEYGFAVGNSEGKGADVDYVYSGTFTTGYRYKFKVANFYALGFDVYYCYMSYHLNQDSTSKLVPNSIVHDKEKLKFNNAGIELYNRINLGKRGDRIGNFIDAGVYFNWAFSIKHYTEDKLDSKNEHRAKFVEMVNKNLDYTERYNYGWRCRVGFNRYVISLSYRVSDLFNDQFEAELPRYIVGIQIGLHE